MNLLYLLNTNICTLEEATGVIKLIPVNHAIITNREKYFSSII